MRILTLNYSLRYPSLQKCPFRVSCFSYMYVTTIISSAFRYMYYKFFFLRLSQIYGLLTDLFRSRWLDIGQVVFFACLWTEVHKHAKKKKWGAIFSYLGRKSSWSMKDLLFGFRGNLSRGTQRVARAGKLTLSCTLG